MQSYNPKSANEETTTRQLRPGSPLGGEFGLSGHEPGFVLGFDSSAETFDNGPDLVCLSHLRWNFVYQRPQHLMTRCARERRVFYFEEPIPKAISAPRLEVGMCPSGVCIVVPQLPHGLSESEVEAAQRALIDQLFVECGIRECVLWYYTPMALSFTSHLKPLAVVYDCMDELSGFRGAHGEMSRREAELLSRADVVFTGGVSLYEAKCKQHPNVHAFPSSIDVAHFAQARLPHPEPDDQAGIPHPRLGFAGVIDERMDMSLIGQVASARPDWHIVMVGPIVKLGASEVAHAENIHYLGPKLYKELPAYLSGWDAALMPFAHNEATRHISPTKTPEYLAAGRRVVSTSIRDVVREYGKQGLVHLADSPDDFVRAVEAIIAAPASESWRNKVDAFLEHKSWGHTWSEMMGLLRSAMEAGAQTEMAHAATTAPSPDLFVGR
jgi:UDP-galactopyranose mutase